MRMMGMMTMWMMAMPHRMMKMNIAPVVVPCAAWPGEAEAVGGERALLAGRHAVAEQLLRLLERLVLERLVLNDEDGPRALRDELARRDVVTEGGQRWRRRQRGGHVPLYCCASARHQQHRQAFLLHLTLRGKTHVPATTSRRQAWSADGWSVARVRALSHRAAQPEEEQNKREHRVAE